MFRIQSDNSIICGSYCIAFIKYMLAGKTLLDNTNLFPPNNYKKNDKILSTLKANVTKVDASFQFREKIYETRKYILEEIKHNELISKKYKKACKILNDVEHLLILASTVSSCVSNSAFVSLVGIPVGVGSPAATIKFV